MQNISAYHRLLQKQNLIWRFKAMEAWMPMIIMTAFTILTGIIAFVGGMLKKGEE